MKTLITLIALGAILSADICGIALRSFLDHEKLVGHTQEELMLCKLIVKDFDTILDNCELNDSKTKELTFIKEETEIVCENLKPVE